MPYLGPNDMYIDQGPKDGGEGWKLESVNQHASSSMEYIVASDNTVLRMHAESHLNETWSSADTTLTNTVVGELTDEQFLTSITSTCTAQCTSPIKLMSGSAFKLTKDPEELLQ